MCKTTIFHLGVIVFAICLSTQVVSQSSTEPPSTTMNTTTTPTNSTMPTWATNTYSVSTNTTSPTGTGLSLHTAAAFTSSSLPILVTAASLLQSLCC
ncbi:mucin-2-like [Nerophis ophidion]|uniref:mucin-2-like n=1 Tax=Nerophis ophidion TaxID=159077 RepID=UPI002ADF6E04|nr:mucin-2-like [Nerophis ophidion]